VERILVLPGATVQADTVLLELSNAELELEAVNAEWQLKSAQAELAALEVNLRNELLALEASVARVAADHNEARLREEVDQELFDDGLISERNRKLSKGRVEELAKLYEIEEKRLETWEASEQARLAAQQARVEQARALHNLRRAQVKSLQVRAGTDGVLEQLPVEVGQQVAAGTILAKVTDARTLKAVLRIPETQASDVQPGQVAEIDTRNVVISGRVARIDPAVQDGTVAVDVSLEGELPKDARPDLTVVGTIEIERLDDVLYVGRPVYGQAHSTVGLFRLGG
jgi:HlyD family secretion protein